MRIKKILCTLLTISLLFTSTDITSYAAESSNPAQTEEASENHSSNENDSTKENSAENNSNAESSFKENSSTEDDDIEESSTTKVETTAQDENTTAQDKTSTDEETTTQEETTIQDENSTAPKETTIQDESTTAPEETTIQDENSTAPEETSTDEETTTDNETETETESEISILGDDLSIEAANGLGNLLMDELQIAAQEGQSEAQASYAISEIEMSGSTAEVSLHVSNSCTVVVSIYKENDNKPLAFGSALVAAGENKVSVPIEIDSMPEYFVIKGHIIDTDSLRPLSKEYESNMYTQAMQEFLAKKTTDFDADKVLNLDDDEKTNFAVVSEGNTLIKAFEDKTNSSIIVNELINYDDTTKTYTFANIDETIKKLQQGDIFTYQNETSQEEADVILAIKVQSIEIKESTDKGTLAVITASDDKLKANDVFEYIKIEETATTADASEIDGNSCPAGVEYLGRDTAVGYAITNEDNPFSVSDKWKLPLKELGNDDDDDDKIVNGDFSGSIEVELSFTLNVKYYYDFWEKIAYIDFNFPISFGIKGNCELSGELKIPLVRTAPEIQTPLITVTYVPKFVAKVSLKGEFELNLVEEFGLCAGWGADNIGPRAPAPEMKGDIKIEADGYIGIDFNPALKVASGAIVDAELNVGAHVGVTASNAVSELHDCGLLCFSGSFYWEIPFTAEFKLLEIELTDAEGNDPSDLKSTLEIGGSEIFNNKHDLGNFYFCDKHEKKILFGTCPYITSTVNVSIMVQDSAGNPVQGATVSTNEQTYTEKTNAEGVIEIEVPEGKQHFLAAYIDTKDNLPHTGSITYDVKKDERTKPLIQLDKMKANLPKSQKIKHLDYGNGYNGISWLAVTEDNSLYTWGYNQSSLGNGSTTDHQSPIKIMDNIKEAVMDRNTSSYACAAAVSLDGQLYMWGNNGHGQLGLGLDSSERPNLTQPTEVLLPEQVEKVRISNSTVAVITTTHNLYMWGSNNGRLGLGEDENGKPITTDFNQPQKIMENVLDVKISSGNTMVLTTDGNVYIWGSSSGGMLGDGSTTSKYAADIENPILTNIQSIELSSSNAAAVTKDGDLYIWGGNSNGQTGTGSTSSSSKVAKANISNVDNVILFSRWVSATTENGDLYMWGYNKNGLLGDGSHEIRTIPYKVSELENMSITEMYSLSLSTLTNSSLEKTLAVTKNNELWQWGGNGSGNSVTDAEIPKKKISNTKHLVLAHQEYSRAYTNNTCYISMTDGSVWNYSGNSLSFIPFTEVSDALPQNVYALDSNDFTDDTDNQIATYALSDYRSPKTFTGLVPGELYNFYAMKSRTASAPLENYNMLSIAQGTADKNGELTITFQLREDYDTPDLFVVGQTQLSLSDSIDKITVTGVEDLTYNGNDQYINPTITFDGRQLTEGTDYYLSGDYKAKDIGSYTVIIVGTGIYSGAVAVDYQVNPIMRTVTFDSDGGSTIESQLIEDGQYAIEPEPPVKDNYRFNGWYLNGRAYNFATTKVTQDITLTARWEALKPLTAPTSDIPSGSTIDSGTKITLRCQTTDVVIYYTTDGTDPTKESQIYQEPIIIAADSAETVTIKAFASKEGWLDSNIVSFVYTISASATGYIITFDSDGGSLVESQFVESGQTAVEPDAPIKEGFRFIGWYLEEEPYNFADEVTKDITLKAHWEELTIISAPVSNIPSGRTIPSGTSIILTCAEPEAMIYYTTDGSEPTRQSTYYRTPIQITNDTTIKAFASKEGFRDSETVSFSYKISAAKPDEDNDYETVLPDDIPDGNIPDGLWIAGIQQSYPYTGMAVKPEAHVYNGNKRLQEGRDYTIRYKNNIKASDTATIIVKGKGNYSGTETKTFQITPLDLNDNRIEADDITVAYNNKVQKPVPVVTFNGKKLKKKKDFTISYSSIDKGVIGANQQVGSYEIELKAKQNSNFAGSRTIRLTVSDKILISQAKTSKIANQPYNNGTEIKPQFTVTIKADTLTEGQDYTVTYQNNTEIGTAAAILTGIGKYAGTKKITFKITGKSIAKASVSILGSSIYNGTEQQPGLTVTLNGTALTEGTSYKVQYTNNIKAGTATVIITGINDCTGTVKKTFKILPFDLASDAQNNAANRQITGLDENLIVKYVKGGAKPILTLTYKGIVLKEGTDYTISFHNNKKPATLNDTKAPTFIIKGKGNFKGTFSKTFTIEAKPLNDFESPVTISAPDVGYVDKAGKYISKPVLTDADGTKLVLGKDYNNIVYTRKNGEIETVLTKQDKAEVGTTIYVKVSGTGIYAGGELETSYKITASDFSKAKIVIKPQEYTGDAISLNQEAIQSVKAGGSDITAQYGISYEIIPESYKNNVKKGTASVSIRGTGNYGGTKTVKFKITTKKFGGFLWFWK